MNDPHASRSPIYLIDGSSYLYRAFHALPNLTNSAGEPTGALLGVANMLRRLLNEAQPEHIAVVFDAPGPTFRHRMYPEYKAHRPPMPEELRRQVEAILELVGILGLPLLQVPGVEADDVIGTLAARAEAAGMDVVISTGDKDLAQLVSPHTTLVNTMTDTTLDAEAVEHKFGVRPEQIVDYLALTGDKSDNIPGVEKCGPKTASRWLQQHGDLDTVMAQADDISGKIGENLRAALAKLPLSRELARIRHDVELETSPGELRREAVDESALRAFLERYEFSSWLQELGAEDPVAGAADYQLVTDASELARWIERLGASDLFAFDTETSDLDPMRADLVGLSFATHAGEAAYVPLAHDYPGAPAQLPRNEVLAALRSLLEAEHPAKVGQHIKYDMNVLSRYGLTIGGVAFDTMLESYVLNSTGSRHDMDSLALKYLGRQTTHYEDIAGKGAKQIPFSQVEVETAGHYAAEDADITLQLHEHLWPRLQENPTLASLLRELEVPLIPVLARMEQRGVLIDGELLAAQGRELAAQMADLEHRAHEAAGQAFNLGSPKQLQDILFDKLELPVLRKTPKGQASTAEDVLQELAGEYELPQLILEYRSLSKLKSTYTDRLPEQINPETGRVHTSYHQAVAATGRLSSANPNLQNIPIRTPQGRRIRKAFIAPRGQRILACDYSQIELRIMAHFSGDPGLLEAFQQGVDIHRATAGEVFGTPYDEVSADQRRAAKAINFGLMYGMSAFGLSRQLDIGRAEAQAYIDTYFERYPGVAEFMERTRQQARDQGFVETLRGRRLYLPDIHAGNLQRRQAAERAAINAPMQGTAADIIKQAMLEVDRWLTQAHPAAHLVMQVHDELVLEVPREELEAVSEGVVQRMAKAARLEVPLVVEAGSGADWDSAH
ncbi:MAG: DNA polymerase I [Xanthomonadales bacterium]|nr:DNA polymerase I [Xanthomonadales bacterium]NIN60145.1 DNA polymerase I [Xanthomonadales bacterium]NIN74292.1 DNA polymerase I [Xanthomonadales bacterium]NIO12801.1 DNA polymerase I [Xanthomonadales bacterium]NIP12538.1 DNA polymerase I [Xanthomonadales bacterium]